MNENLPCNPCATHENTTVNENNRASIPYAQTN